MSNVLDLLVNVGIQDNGRISPALADEMRAERGYFREMLKRDLRNMYRREGVPIHSGELRAAIEAARMHWTDDEICRSLAVGWNRIEECMWGRDPITGERTGEADCALFGGCRQALKTLATGQWTVAPRPQDSFEPEPETPAPESEAPKPVAPRKLRTYWRANNLTPEAAAARDIIRGYLKQLRPMTRKEVAIASGITFSDLTEPIGYAVCGASTVRRLRHWLATDAGKEALAKATGKVAPGDWRKNRKTAVKEKVEEHG